MTYETILAEATQAYDACTNGNSYDVQKILFNIQESCKREILAAQARSRGTGEVQRKKAAEAIIKDVPEYREWMRGYTEIGEDFCLSNGEVLKNGIIITNGYVMYVGSPIAGTTEVTDKSKVSEVCKLARSFVGYHDSRDFKNTEAVDLVELKTNLKIAKAKAKTEKIKKQLIISHFKEACLITHNSKGEKNAIYNADYVIKACEMLGGKEWKITTSGRVLGAVIEGKNGFCVVMPINKKEWLED